MLPHARDTLGARASARSAPDLALVDFQLPGIDGLELARQLHADPKTRTLPVIMLSGVAVEETRVQAIKEGVRDFLQKPVAGAELRARVDALAQHVEAQRRERDEVRQRLQESVERFQLLLSAVKEYAIFMVSPDGRVASWNSGAELIKGYKEEEVLGRPLSVFYPPEGQQRAAHLLTEALNAILGWAHVLRSSQGDLAAVTRAVEVIERNGKLQARLIEDTLDMSAIMAGRVTLDAAALDLVDPVTRAVEAAEPAAAARSVVIHSEVWSVGLVFGDATRLQQVVANILDNAIKYTPPGGQIIARELVALHHGRITATSAPDRDPNSP